MHQFQRQILKLFWGQFLLSFIVGSSSAHCE